MQSPLNRYALVTTEEISSAKMQAIFRLRKRLVVDQCGRKLATDGEIERDPFDAWYTEHWLLFRLQGAEHASKR